jgi:hypothetical protein
LHLNLALRGGDEARMQAPRGRDRVRPLEAVGLSQSASMGWSSRRTLVPAGTSISCCR